MKRLVIVLVVLAGLVAAADRVGVWLAERAAVDRALAQGLTGAAVDIRGVPFLTQLAARKLSDVAVTGDSYRPAAPSGTTLLTELTDVRVLARDVSISSATDPTAGQLTMRGVVAYAAVSAAAGPDTEVAAGTGDQVRVVRRVERFGRSLTVRALARLSVEQGEIVVRPTEASVDGAGLLGELASDALLPLVTLRYPVPGLPSGLVLTGVQPGSDGLAVTLSGRAVPLSTLD